MKPGTFRPGADPRRGGKGGPAPGARGISVAIRGTLGRDARTLCEQVRQLAASGDPAGLLAAAILLGAVLTPGANKGDDEADAAVSPAVPAISA